MQRQFIYGALAMLGVLLLMGAAAVGGRQWQISVTTPLPVAGGYTTKTAIVADSGTVSAEIDMEGYTLMAVSLPSGLEGTSLKYQCATASGGTFQDIQDDSGTDCENTTALSQVTAPAAGACAVAVAACRFLKFVVASQTGASTITAIVK